MSCSLHPALPCGFVQAVLVSCNGMFLHNLSWRGKGIWEAKCFHVPVQQAQAGPIAGPVSQPGRGGRSHSLVPGGGYERLGSRLSSCQGPSCEHPTVLENLADLTPLGPHPPTGVQPGPCSHPESAPAAPLPQPSHLLSQYLAPFH